MKGSTIKLSQASTTAQTSGSGQGGTITVNAESLSLEKGAQLNTMTSSAAQDAGAGGVISLNAKTISLDTKAITTAATEGAGIGGTIQVSTDTLTIKGGSQLSTAASGTGNAGNIQINTAASRDLTIGFDADKPQDPGPGSAINAKTTAGGAGGLISLGSSSKALTKIGRAHV